MPGRNVGLAHPLCRQRRLIPGALRRRIYLPCPDVRPRRLIVSAYNKGLMRKCDPMHAFRTMQRNHMPWACRIGNLPRTRPAEKRRDDDRVELPGLGARTNGRALGLEMRPPTSGGNRSHGWRKLYRPDQQLLFPGTSRANGCTTIRSGTGWIEANARQAIPGQFLVL